MRILWLGYLFITGIFACTAGHTASEDLKLHEIPLATLSREVVLNICGVDIELPDDDGGQAAFLAQFREQYATIVPKILQSRLTPHTDMKFIGVLEATKFHECELPCIYTAIYNPRTNLHVLSPLVGFIAKEKIDTARKQLGPEFAIIGG